MTEQQMYIITASTTSGKTNIKYFLSEKRATAYKEQLELHERIKSPSLRRTFGIDLEWIDREIEPNEDVIVREVKY